MPNFRRKIMLTSKKRILMKNQIYSPISVLLLILFFTFIADSAIAQEATIVDTTHYKVEFENDHVRIIRITYAPGEKSVMHVHKAGVVVFLTDSQTKFSFPDGKTEELGGKAGQALWFPATKHLPENIGDNPFEAVYIELKTPSKKD
jgi:quercetin dioxygenase-like cupin family protein